MAGLLSTALVLWVAGGLRGRTVSAHFRVIR